MMPMRGPITVKYKGYTIQLIIGKNHWGYRIIGPNSNGQWFDGFALYESALKSAKNEVNGMTK